MKLQNGYKVIYEKAADGKRTFYASKSNVYPTSEDVEIASFSDADFAGKVIYEHAGKFYVSNGSLPEYDENGKPKDSAVEGFDEIFVNKEEENDNTEEVSKFAAKIDETEYETLAEAIESAENGQTVVLLNDCNCGGTVINKSITLDFNGHTYTLTDPAVGSTGTESNGLQLLKGNDVNLKNGTLEIAESDKEKFYILIQNYANLTVENMTLDGTNLDKWSSTDGDSYVLSNNSGTVNVIGETNIIANEDGDKAFAFDVCKFRNYTAPIVNVATTGKIVGKIEVTESIATNLNISNGSYTVEIMPDWCAEGFAPVAHEDGTFGVQEVSQDSVE